MRMPENMRKFKPGAICCKQGKLLSVLRVGIIFLHRHERNSKKDRWAANTEPLPFLREKIILGKQILPIKTSKVHGRILQWAFV